MTELEIDLKEVVYRKDDGNEYIKVNNLKLYIEELLQYFTERVNKAKDDIVSLLDVIVSNTNSPDRLVQFNVSNKLVEFNAAMEAIYKCQKILCTYDCYDPESEIRFDNFKFILDIFGYNDPAYNYALTH